MGSSIVRMWTGLVALMCSIMQARVVVLPDAGRAGDQDQAALHLGQLPDDGGRPSSSKVGLPTRTRRSTMLTEPRW